MSPSCFARISFGPGSFSSFHQRSPCISVFFRQLSLCGQPGHLVFLFRRHFFHRARNSAVVSRFSSGWSSPAGLSGQKPYVAALAWVYSREGNCAPVWCRSVHTSNVNKTLRTVTGCLLRTPIEQLAILTGVHLARLRCNAATACVGGRVLGA